MERCGGAGAAGVFPLRFAGQAIAAMGFLAQASAKFDGIEPADALNRAVLAFKSGRIGVKFALSLGQPGYGTPLGLGDGIASYKEFGQLDPMLGAFPIEPLQFVVGRPHEKAPCWNLNHLQGDAVQVFAVAIDALFAAVEGDAG